MKTKNSNYDFKFFMSTQHDKNYKGFDLYLSDIIVDGNMGEVDDGGGRSTNDYDPAGLMGNGRYRINMNLNTNLVWMTKVFCILLAFAFCTSCGDNCPKEHCKINKEKDNFAVVYTGRWDTVIIDTLFLQRGNKISHIDILNLFEYSTSKKCFTTDTLQFTTMVSDTIGIIHYHQFNEWSYRAYFYNPLGVFYIVRTDFPAEYYVGYYSGINSALLDSLLVIAKSDHTNRMNEMLKVIEVNSIDTTNFVKQ